MKTNFSCSISTQKQAVCCSAKPNKHQMAWLMNNANEAFSTGSLFKSFNRRLFTLILHSHLSVSLHVSSPLGSAGVFGAVSEPFFKTSRQGHSQSKCMLMLILQEPPASLPLLSQPGQMWHCGLPGLAGGANLEQLSLI